MGYAERADGVDSDSSGQPFEGYILCIATASSLRKRLARAGNSNRPAASLY